MFVEGGIESYRIVGVVDYRAEVLVGGVVSIYYRVVGGS